VKAASATREGFSRCRRPRECRGGVAGPGVLPRQARTAHLHLGPRLPGRLDLGPVRSLLGGGERELIPHADPPAPGEPRISDEDAAWAPSGKRIVFARRIDGGNLRLFVSRDGFADAREIPLPADMYARSPAFAPDGRTVVFVSVVSGGDPSQEVTWEADGEVWTVRTDGKRLRRLRRGDRPVWSPAGNRIAYNDPCGSLHVMRPDGSGDRQVVNALRGGMCLGVGRPDFSPDGRRLLYSVGRPATAPGDGRIIDYEIYAIGVDGRGRRRVTTTPDTQNAFSPVWSPDGRTIIYERHGSDQSVAGVWRVPATGGSGRRLFPHLGFDLAWQPRR
jgi:Tol biopolymer transport system component